MRFEKGRSGNPGGRPKAVMEVIEAARQHTALAIRTLADVCEDQDKPPAARVAAAGILLDRGWGKPFQPTDDGDGTETGNEGWIMKLSGDKLRPLMEWIADTKAEDAQRVDKVVRDHLA